MEIRSLRLINFRNFVKRDFDIGKETVVAGGNGSGKSNLLEAVYMLAVGKSFKAERDEEMAGYGQQIFRVQGLVFNGDREMVDLAVLLSDRRKRFEINGVPKRMSDFTGTFRAVLFGPQDMELITGSPSGRRRYLDFVISQADREYRRNLISYERGLRQRNRLLEDIRDKGTSRTQLFFWDRLLIKNGNYITGKREEYLGRLNIQDSRFRIFYDKSVISEPRLKQYEAQEVAAAVTLVGPHRDDFIVNVRESISNVQYKDVSKYGSRGEQRMGVVWLKRGELRYLTTEGELPVLLYDDIFSELDHEHRSIIEKETEIFVKNGGQVIITTADEHMVPEGKEWVRIKL
jgi:DNA replication and repair protein RecF